MCVAQALNLSISPNCCRNVENDVDLLHEKGPFVCFNAQAGQHAIAADGNDFVTEFRVITFDKVEKLKFNQKFVIFFKSFFVDFCSKHEKFEEK